MELRHLRYFVAVADHGGISHAADRLRIAQPAVSRQIKDLEAEMGVDLLLREGRRVVLTDAGRAFATQARAILASTDAATYEAQQIAKGTAGRLRIGLLESASWSGHMPIALNRYARRYPDVRLDISPMSSLDQIDALMAGDLDAGFVYRQNSLDDEKLNAHWLRTDDVVLAASTDLVFDSDGPLELEDIDGLPLVAFPRAVAPAYHDQLADAWRGIGLDPVIVQEAENETTMLSLVSAGVGCAFVNSANMHRPPERVQFRQVQGLSVPIEFLFITGKNPGTLTQGLSEITRQIDTQ
ncbi:LysR family transcriptional regulator [uncultured Tateyamaria sp.]|uniref:LysR family transcriptional regulator n=1 Tax=uncultured Tateyamaria sp. TaxID=455651 RepID=UPI002602AC94|nr:LysR family transcriptional regulator [uncultured Tateyamaria sp.]